MRTKILRLFAVLGLIAGLSLSGTALAQPQLGAGASDIATIPVDLLPPGARALGLAGAFGAVADDATAAVANPAGLTILSASEFSLHVRDSDFDINFLDVDAYNSGFLGTAGNLNKRYEDSGSDVSFASFVKPFDRFTLSAYYLNQVSLDSIAAPESVFVPNFVDTYTNEQSIAADVEAFGVGMGFRINDFVSIGLSIQQTELDVRSFDMWAVEDFFDNEFQLNMLGCDQGVITCAPASDYANVIQDFNSFGTILDDSDTDTTFNVGVLFNPNGKFSVGIVYREGGDFDFTPMRFRQNAFGCVGTGGLSADCLMVLPASPGIPNITPENIPSDPNNPGSRPLVTSVELPDTLTFGVAWRPTDTLLLSLDINSVTYGDLRPPRPITLGFNIDVNDLQTRGFFTDPNIAALAGPITEPLDDEVTIHFGVEKVFPLSGDFLSMYTLTLRGGAFTDEDHDGNRLHDADDTHGVIGIGATFGDHFQFDLAGEFSDRVDNIVLSAIYRF